MINASTPVEDYRANISLQGFLGDFFTNFHFAEAIRSGQQPYLDIYRALDMSICGIQAYRSALEDGAPYEVPDFRDEQVRSKYEDDHWSPDPARKGPGQPLPSKNQLPLFLSEPVLPKFTLQN